MIYPYLLQIIMISGFSVSKMHKFYQTLSDETGVQNIMALALTTDGLIDYLKEIL